MRNSETASPADRSPKLYMAGRPFRVEVKPDGGLENVIRLNRTTDSQRTSIARLHILYEFLATETQKIALFNLRTYTGREEALNAINKIQGLIDSVPNHIETDFSSYFRAPKEQRLVAKIKAEVAKIDFRLNRCREQIKAIGLRQGQEGSDITEKTVAEKGNPFRKFTNKARQQFQAWVGAVAMAVPVISGAPLQPMSDANRIDRVPAALDSSADFTSHEPSEIKVDQVLSEFFSNVSSINELLDGLEHAIAEILGSARSRAEANDLSLLERRFTTPDLTSTGSSVSERMLERELASQTPENNQAAEVVNRFEIPVFTLNSAAGAKLSEAISTEIPVDGISITLPDGFLSGDISAFFETNPELVTQITTLKETLTNFRSLGGDGELQLIVLPNQDGTFKTAVIIGISKTFTEGEITFTAGSLYGSAENYIINVDRRGLAIKTVPVVGFPTTPVADFVTPMTQTALEPIIVSDGSLVLSEVKVENRERVTISVEGKIIFLGEYRARANQPVNLRSKPDRTSERVTTSKDFILLIGDKQTYSSLVGDLPLQTELNGQGVHFGIDGIIFNRDADGTEWVAARVPDTNTSGWVSTEVVALETVTPEPVPLAPDIQTKATLTPVPDKTKDPNDLPDTIQTQPFNEGHIIIEGGKMFVYRENLGQYVEITDSFDTLYGGTTNLERATDSPYGNGKEERVITFDQNMKTHAEAGMRQFYLELYKEAFDVDDAQAEQLLLADTPIPVNILINSENFLKQGWMTALNSRVLNIVPSAGMSITFIEHLPYPRVMNGPRPLNNTLAETAFTSGPGGERDVIIDYGTSVWVNADGRIMLVTASSNRNSDSLSLTSKLVNSIDYLRRSVGSTSEVSEATPNPAHRVDYVRSDESTKEIFDAFNVPMTADSRNLTLEEWQRHLLVNVSE